MIILSRETSNFEENTPIDISVFVAQPAMMGGTQWLPLPQSLPRPGLISQGQRVQKEEVEDFRKGQGTGGSMGSIWGPMTNWLVINPSKSFNQLGIQATASEEVREL